MTENPGLSFLPNFTPPGIDTNLVKQVTGMISGAVTGAETAATTAAGTAVDDVTKAATTAVEDVTKTAEQATTAVVSTAPVIAGSIPASGVPALPPAVTTITQAIEDAAKAAAEHTVTQATSGLELAAQNAVINVLHQITLPTPTPPALSDFVRADARSRAFRTLLSGLTLTVLTAVIGALGMASGLNWFDRNTWPAIATIFTTSIFSAVMAYIGRIVKEPAHTAPITNLLAKVPPTTG